MRKTDGVRREEWDASKEGRHRKKRERVAGRDGQLKG